MLCWDLACVATVRVTKTIIDVGNMSASMSLVLRVRLAYDVYPLCGCLVSSSVIVLSTSFGKESARCYTIAMLCIAVLAMLSPQHAEAMVALACADPSVYVCTVVGQCVVTGR